MTHSVWMTPCAAASLIAGILPDDNLTHGPRPGNAPPAAGPRLSRDADGDAPVRAGDDRRDRGFDLPQGGYADAHHGVGPTARIAVRRLPRSRPRGTRARSAGIRPIAAHGLRHARRGRCPVRHRQRLRRCDARAPAAGRGRRALAAARGHRWTRRDQAPRRARPGRGRPFVPGSPGGPAAATRVRRNPTT